MTLVGMPYDLKAKCSWDGDLLHIELPETPKAIHVHHPCGSTFFGVPTGVEQELRSENAKLRELCKDIMAFVEDDDACERCGHDAECVEAADGELVLPYEGLCLMLDLFADRMRELEIEVE